ncbi:hypothetical protein [Pseudomonas sp. Ga0074129]|uniref:hypothetical protein n=1 Tax=unclassified Pseudomonas TaxID=196821 RepID=UPI0025E7D546|nr:hypothetical protein [Pseudomonas sp. Ga0074129]
MATTFLGAGFSVFSNALQPLINTHKAMARVLLKGIGNPHMISKKPLATCVVSAQA